MSRRFQFSLRALLAVTTLAAIAIWLATLGGIAIVAGFPLVVAAVWGIHRKDGVFLSALLLVLAISAAFLLGGM
jgi:hypothetical protein